MTERELFEAIGHVDDDLILAADAPARKRRKPPVYWRNLVAVSACACACFVAVRVGLVTAYGSTQNETAMAAETADEPLMGAAAPQAEPDESAKAVEGASGDTDSAASSIALGLARCVQIDGVRYFESPALIDFAADRDPDGVIETSVDRDAFPETDGCSNFGTGYSYWMTGDGTVVVEIDGEYCEFAAN